MQPHMVAAPYVHNTRILSLCLRAQVTSAYDGQEALDKLAEAGGPDAFDVILMDLHMPLKVHPAHMEDAAAVQQTLLCLSIAQ